MRIKFQGINRKNDVRLKCKRVTFTAETPEEEVELAAMLRERLGVKATPEEIANSNPRVCGGEWSDRES